MHPWDPVELPRGLRFYRRWEIIAWKGTTSVRVRLSFVDGYPEHYIHVRGSQSVARADFETNTYVCLDHTPHLLDVDRFLTVRDGVEGRRRAGRRHARGLRAHEDGHEQGGRALPAQHRAHRRSVLRRASRRSRCARGRRHRRGGGRARRVDREGSESPRADREGDAPPRRDHDPTHDGPSPEGARHRRHGVHRACARPQAARRRPGRATARPRSEHRTRRICSGRTSTSCAATSPISSASPRHCPASSVVYHLARGNGNTWPEFQKYDVAPTKALAELCLQHEVGRFIYTSSIALYNAGKGVGTITEDTPPGRRVTDPYARSKVENEANLFALHREKGFPVVILRPGIVLGRGGTPAALGRGGWPYPSVARLWGEGNNKLPIVLVDDCVDAMVRAMTMPGIDGRSYNLVGPPLLTANEYLDELEARAGIKLRRVPTSSWQYYGEALAKWAIKKVGRDPNARRPTFADWDGRTFAATLDGGRAEAELGWRPCRDRDALVRDGIWGPTDEWFEKDAAAQ